MQAARVNVASSEGLFPCENLPSRLLAWKLRSRLDVRPQAGRAYGLERVFRRLGVNGVLGRPRLA